MNRHAPKSVRLSLIVAVCLMCQAALGQQNKPVEQHLLYVAEPGVRDYQQFGGHGVLVFDIDAGHKLLRRIPTAGLDGTGKPLNVKGICASAATGRLYVSTLTKLECIDLLTEKPLWEKAYDGGCDRMSISPDGKTIYLPSLEGPHWHVINAINGNILAKISPRSGAHNTIYGPDGKEAYLAGLHSPDLTISDTTKHNMERTVGPFSAPIRPFTINGSQTLVFVCVNELLGFEIGDLRTGKMLHRLEVQGVKKGPTERHGCPSHGVGLTPDEKELWVVDGFNSKVHVFDMATMPPKQMLSIPVRYQPGWITFSIDGKFGYPSTGDIIDVKSHKVISTLTDEVGRPVQSEKLMEIDFADGKPIRTGDQFGIGHVGPATAAASNEKAGEWQSLFDGKTLGQWVNTSFGGEGEVHVENGNLTLESGVSLTGVKYKGEIPKMNFEVTLDAQRVEGSDFFCGLTFPVGENFASLILGGWGGAVCGISSLDDEDAAHNDTTTVHKFEKGKWYHVRLRVTSGKIQTWVNDEKIVDAVTTGKKISVRNEVIPSEPFGLASYQTAAAIKEIRIRKLGADEAGSGK